MAAAIGIAKTATEIFLGVGEVSIDNLTFKLHYKWSVTLFIVCSVLVQTSQFFGEPVQCETVRVQLFQVYFKHAFGVIRIKYWNLSLNILAPKIGNCKVVCQASEIYSFFEAEGSDFKHQRGAM